MVYAATCALIRKIKLVEDLLSSEEKCQKHKLCVISLGKPAFESQQSETFRLFRLTLFVRNSTTRAVLLKIQLLKWTSFTKLYSTVWNRCHFVWHFI